MHDELHSFNERVLHDLCITCTEKATELVTWVCRCTAWLWQCWMMT